MSLVAPFAAAILLLSACKGTDANAAAKLDSEPPPVQVKTAVVEERPMPRFLAATGSLRAERETEVAANAVGKVVETFVERGSVVRQGDPLVRLDVLTASLSQAQARSQTKLAEHNAKLARDECARAEALLKGSVIAQSEYDRRMTTCRTSDESVSIARAGAQLAEKGVGDAIVRAPFAGVVGERFINAGQFVRAETRVASLFVLDPLRLEITIPESECAAATRNQPVEFKVAAFPDTIFSGTVKFISPVVRALSRDLVIEAVVPNRDGRLRAGMFAAVKLRVGEAPVAVAPAAALRKGEVASSVFAVDNGRATERVVELGEARGGLVAIVAGVKPGEKLVLAPGADLRDGARVAE